MTGCTGGQCRSCEDEDMQMSMDELRRRMDNEMVANAQVDERLQDDFQRWQEIVKVRWIMYEEQRRHNMRCQSMARGATIWRILSMVQQELEEKLQLQKVLGSCQRFPSPMALMDDERKVGGELLVLEPVRDVLSGRGGCDPWDTLQQQSSGQLQDDRAQQSEPEPWNVQDMPDECGCTTCEECRRQKKLQQQPQDQSRMDNNPTQQQQLQQQQPQPKSRFRDDCNCLSAAILEKTRQQPSQPSQQSKSTFCGRFGCQFLGDSEQHGCSRRSSCLPNFLQRFHKVSKLNQSGMLVPAKALLDLAQELPQNVGRSATWTCHTLPSQLHNVAHVAQSSHETVGNIPQRPRRITEDPNYVHYDPLLVYVNEKFHVDATSGMGNTVCREGSQTSYYSAIRLMEPKAEPVSESLLGYCPLCDKRHLRLPPPF